MSKFAVIVFSEEVRAYQGLEALQQLHAEGTLTVYGTGVVQRDADGTVRILKRADQCPAGLGVGALVGGLVGLFGGPVGAAVGAAVGGAAGGLRDELHVIMSDDFLERVEQTPGLRQVRRDRGDLRAVGRSARPADRQARGKGGPRGARCARLRWCSFPSARNWHPIRSLQSVR